MSVWDSHQHVLYSPPLLGVFLGRNRFAKGRIDPGPGSVGQLGLGLSQGQLNT